jgi:hypothetical protein
VKVEMIAAGTNDDRQRRPALDEQILVAPGAEALGEIVKLRQRPQLQVPLDRCRAEGERSVLAHPVEGLTILTLFLVEARAE